MKKSRFRLALCTGGGDCPGLNPAIRAITKAACGLYGMEVTGIRDGTDGLLRTPADLVALDSERVHELTDRGGTVLGTSNQGNPFRIPGQGEKILQQMRKAFKAGRFDAMIVIGGDGTHFMTRNLVEAGLPIVGIPKTIDNDLMGTDETIGFASAVDIASHAALRLATSADAHNRIMILEVMGRDAGHIALHSALASGANAALLPEIPFDTQTLAERVRARSKLGRNGFLIIAAEGAAPAGGERHYYETGSGSKALGGIGAWLARELHQQTGIDARATVLGHLQRGGPPVPHDRIMAAELGVRAVGMVSRGEFGNIVARLQGKPVVISYGKIKDQRRRVDLKGIQTQTAEATGIWLGRSWNYSLAL